MLPPEVVAPVEPEVPVLLLVPAAPPDEGVVAVELPEAPMPEVVPEDEVPLDGVVLEAADPEGVDIVPLAEPPDEPMPEAVPDAVPDAVVPQAAKAALHTMGRRILIIYNSFADEGCFPLRTGWPGVVVGVFPMGRPIL